MKSLSSFSDAAAYSSARPFWATAASTTSLSSFSAGAAYSSANPFWDTAASTTPLSFFIAGMAEESSRPFWDTFASTELLKSSHEAYPETADLEPQLGKRNQGSGFHWSSWLNVRIVRSYVRNASIFGKKWRAVTKRDRELERG